MAGYRRKLWMVLYCYTVHLCCSGVVSEEPQEDHIGGGTGVGAGPLPEEAREVNSVFQPCSMLSNLQDAVLQVMTAHYEYGHGIHRLHGLVGTLQLDLADLKAQLVEVERRQVEGAGLTEENKVGLKANAKEGVTNQEKLTGKNGEKEGLRGRVGEKDKENGTGKGEKHHLKSHHLKVNSKGEQWALNGNLEQQLGGSSKGQEEKAHHHHTHHPQGVPTEKGKAGEEVDDITGELENLVKSTTTGNNLDSSSSSHDTQVPTDKGRVALAELLSPSSSSRPTTAETSTTSLVPYRKEFLDTMSSYMAGYFNSSLYKDTYPSFSLLVYNVTELLTYHGGRLAALQRRLHGVRKQVRQATNTMADWEKTLKLYDSRMISHMLEKQREINTALERRLSTLEESVKLQGVMLHRDQAKASQHPSGGECPAGFVRHASSCYLFGNLTAHWVDAEKHCQSQHDNAHLVAIETESEHDFIVMYRQYNAAHWSSYYVWTGGTNMLEGGGWRWVSNQLPLSYSRWRSGKAATRGRDEQHCVYFPTVGGDSKWDDWHCYAARLNFVCEIQV